MRRYGQRLVEGVALACALVFAMASPPVAQAAAQTAAQGGATEVTSEEVVVVESDDTRALVAPVALYPDPILALVLQASTLPLEVVQAERFLERRKKDPKLQPDPDWDSSVLGLLNYPRQLELMSEYVDWTEELGNAVVDDLGSVQTAIQDVRLAAYDAGFLKSNKMQKVEVRDDGVRITSTDPDKVSIPTYDPAALLTALDDVEEAEEAADEAALQEDEAAAAAAASAAQEQAPAPAPAAAPGAAPATTPSPPAAPASAYAGEPVTPPAIAYGEPENSFWADAATFGGGAVVGGLLGWGLTEAFDDDDDDDHDHDWNNDDIEDALRDRRDFREQRRDDVLAARDERREDRQATKTAKPTSREDRAAQAREKLNQRPEATGGRTKPAAAASKAKPRQGKVDRGKRDVKLPGAGTQAGVADKVRKRSTGVQSASAPGKPKVAKLAPSKSKQGAAKAGYSGKRDSKGIAASAGGRKQVRTEASRGAKSRTAASSKGSGGGGGGKKAAKRSGGGGGGMAASRGKVASADGARGRASRGGGGKRNK